MAEQSPVPAGELTPHSTARTLASDQRRNQTVELLSAACADGRLTLEDFSDRLETALQARTVNELTPLEADLGPSRPVPAHRTLESTRSFVAVMSSTGGGGHWLLGPATRALAVMGEVVLDLRGAELASSHSRISATAVMGSVKVIVPEGLNVVLNGSAIMGTRTLRGGSGPAPAGAPVIEVTALAVMGEVKVVIKSSKLVPKRIGPFVWDRD